MNQRNVKTPTIAPKKRFPSKLSQLAQNVLNEVENSYCSVSAKEVCDDNFETNRGCLSADQSQQIQNIECAESFYQKGIEMAARDFARTIEDEVKLRIEKIEQLFLKEITSHKLRASKVLEGYNRMMVERSLEMENELKKSAENFTNENSHCSIYPKEVGKENVKTNGKHDQQIFGNISTDEFNQIQSTEDTEGFYQNCSEMSAQNLSADQINQIQNIEDTESFHQKGIETAARDFATTIKNAAKLLIEKIEQLFLEEITSLQLHASKVLEGYNQMMVETIQEKENKVKQSAKNFMNGFENSHSSISPKEVHKENVKTNGERDQQIFGNFSINENYQIQSIEDTESFHQKGIETAARDFATTIKNAAKLLIEKIEQLFLEEITSRKLHASKVLEGHNQLTVETIQEMENKVKKSAKNVINGFENSHFSISPKAVCDENIFGIGGRDQQIFDNLSAEETKQIQSIEDIKNLHQKGIEMASRDFGRRIKNEAILHIEKIEQFFLMEITSRKMLASKLFEEYSQMVIETIQDMENQMKKLTNCTDRELQQIKDCYLKETENVMKISNCDAENEISFKPEIVSKMLSKNSFCSLVYQILMAILLSCIFNCVYASIYEWF